MTLNDTVYKYCTTMSLIFLFRLSDQWPNIREEFLLTKDKTERFSNKVLPRLNANSQFKTLFEEIVVT